MNWGLNFNIPPTPPPHRPPPPTHTHTDMLTQVLHAYNIPKHLVVINIYPVSCTIIIIIVAGAHEALNSCTFCRGIHVSSTLFNIPRLKCLSSYCRLSLDYIILYIWKSCFGSDIDYRDYVYVSSSIIYGSECIRIINRRAFKFQISKISWMIVPPDPTRYVRIHNNVHPSCKPHPHPKTINIFCHW